MGRRHHIWNERRHNPSIGTLGEQMPSNARKTWTAPELVAQLQRAQAVLNLPAGLPLTTFITPDGKLYFGAGYLPAERKADKRSFREAAEEALKRYADKRKIEGESFQLRVAE